MSDPIARPIPATLPEITAANRGFWDHARRGILALPTCRACGHVWFPPSSSCPRCLSQDVEFRATSGRARLWSWVVIHRQYFKDFPPPYLVAFVELESGPMLMSTLVNFAPEQLRCDLPLKATFEKLTDDLHILQFEPDRD
ncbi:MAG: Zn-ribbon domain-containing OB-fold protein [SAR324 cluster bacterium]